jgi:type IV pilus assembly protein PilF
MNTSEQMQFRKAGALALLLMTLSACTVQEFANERKVDPVAGARARVAIAAEYLQKGQLDQAQQHLLKAIELDPKSAEAYNVMGALLERDGDIDKAEKNYRKALSLKPDYSQAHNNYGVLLFRAKRYKDAGEQFSFAANDLGYDRREVALLYLGRSALMLNERDKAKAAFERVLKLNSRSPEAALELADMAFDARDYATAGSFYQRFLRVLDNEPQSARSLWLGIRLARVNKDNNALASYELALKRLYANSAEYQAYLKSLDTGS